MYLEDGLELVAEGLAVPGGHHHTLIPPIIHHRLDDPKNSNADLQSINQSGKAVLRSRNYFIQLRLHFFPHCGCDSSTAFSSPFYVQQHKMIKSLPAK